MDRPVVVSGLGVISSIGIGRQAFWEAVLRGASGISEVTAFDTSKFGRHRAGQVKDFSPEDFIPSRQVSFYGRASQLAIAAVRLALEDAGLPSGSLKKSRTPVIFGTTMTEAQIWDVSCEKFLKGDWQAIGRRDLVNCMSSAIARNVGHFFGLKGENLLIPNACAAGNYSLGRGFDLISRGEAEMAIVGGSDALSRVAFQGFQRLFAMAPEYCAPFDKERKGMLLGEGAGALLLVSEGEALRRRLPVYARVMGYGFSCDAFNMVIPDRKGIKKAISKALAASGVSIDKIDYISAHGTGTGQNDKEESGAINELSASSGKRIPVSSLKSMLGHCMGAASSIESIACCLGIKDGIIPPTINFRTPDPECDIDCVPNQPRQARLDIVLKNSFAFGGNNCCVVFAKG